MRNLSVHFKLGQTRLKAVDNVSFDIYRGETLSLVGESGSGKTTIGRAIMSIHTSNVEGDISFKGQKINEKLSRKQRGRLHMEMQMIFQDPMASLNDRAKVDYIVSEGLYNYRLFDGEADRVAKVEKMLQEVGLTSDFMTRFPHEFSGGQRQRIGIARSLIMNPELIVADEPISALDVSIRAQVINLLNRLKRERNLTYLFIAHDLSAVRFISDRIAVIYKGRLVELAACEELFARPLHPYTRALLAAAPYPDPDVERDKVVQAYHPAAEELEKLLRALSAGALKKKTELYIDTESARMTNTALEAIKSLIDRKSDTLSKPGKCGLYSFVLKRIKLLSLVNSVLENLSPKTIEQSDYLGKLEDKGTLELVSQWRYLTQDKGSKAAEYSDSGAKISDLKKVEKSSGDHPRKGIRRRAAGRHCGIR